MKKTLSILLAVLMLFSLSTVAFAADYNQFFDEGVMNCNEYRIPALYTLNNGKVIGAADMRYGHGSDSPNNIDSLIAISDNGYTGWNYQVLNHFDDYADDANDVMSASFIDMAIAQSSTDRIFVIVDAQPAGCGYLQCEKGTGYVTVNGKNYMLLTTGDNTKAESTFKYYIGDFEGDFAPILNRADGSKTGYTVDKEYDIYNNGKPVTTTQVGSDKTVNQNVFYADAPFKCFLTTFLWMRYSDNGGETWSAPEILTGQIKNSGEYFLGICPGRGYVTTLADGTERVIFMVYDNGKLGWNEFENVSTIYSDDNGVTWERGADTICGLQVGKTSESQIIDLGNGVLRMYARNKGVYLAYADSYDGGHSWTDFVSDLNLAAQGNCMCSFINTSKKINGKNVVLASYASNINARANGVIRVGLVNPGTSIDWISTYTLTGPTEFFAYSCMTELSDRNFGILYEDEASHLAYLIFSVDDSGNIVEVNGENPEIDETPVKLTFWQKLINFFKQLFAKLFNF